MSRIDIDALLQEVSPDAPCGKDLEYDPAFIGLEEEIKGTPEQWISDTVKKPAEEPNWPKVRDDSLGLLPRTKDLRILICLTRALVHTDGLAGLRDSLSLIKQILSRYWDAVHPQLDPDDGYDPTQRINILTGLCDWDTMINPVNKVPLVKSQALGRFSLRDIHLASGQLTPPEGETSIPETTTIEAAFMDCELEQLRSDADAAAQSLTDLDDIETFLGNQVGVKDTASFRELRGSVKEIEQRLSQHLAQRGAEALAAGQESAEQGPASGSGVLASTQGPAGINNDRDVIRSLDLICEYYRRHEPSSPVPLLLQRARRLVTKDFMEILNDLTPDGVAQMDLIRGKTDEE